MLKKMRLTAAALAAALAVAAVPFTAYADESLTDQLKVVGVADDTMTEQVEVVGDAAASKVNMFRLYNPNSGEHFYTANTGERNTLIGYGWNYEGIGWIAPAASDKPVYRLYNENGGEHHYTLDVSERDFLVSVGWKLEGIGWYSDENESVPLYRQYNPNAFANNHNYTTDLQEKNHLVSIGWQDEGIGWYGVGEGKAAATYPTLRALGITGSQYPDSLNARLDSLLNDFSIPFIDRGEDFLSADAYTKAAVLMNDVGMNFAYSDESTTAAGMIEHGSGTCFAYSDLLYCLCRKAGITDVWQCVPGRPVSHGSSVYGSLHRHCVARIDGKYYILDANTVYLIYSAFGMLIEPEEITESYAKYLLGQSDTYTAINP